MHARDSIRGTMDLSLMVVDKYLGDLSDAELLLRPGPGCHTIAWQLGHLIYSGGEMLNSLSAGAAPQLPSGFAEQHSKERASSDDPAGFCSKAEYLAHFANLREAVSTALDKISDADLDAPAPESMRAWFPTVGAVYTLIATHPLMHAGQFVPVRRALGKPVVI